MLNHRLHPFQQHGFSVEECRWRRGLPAENIWSIVKPNTERRRPGSVPLPEVRQPQFTQSYRLLLKEEELYTAGNTARLLGDMFLPSSSKWANTFSLHCKVSQLKPLICFLSSVSKVWGLQIIASSLELDSFTVTVSFIVMLVMMTLPVVS